MSGVGRDLLGTYCLVNEHDGADVMVIPISTRRLNSKKATDEVEVETNAVWTLYYTRAKVRGPVKGPR